MADYADLRRNQAAIFRTIDRIQDVTASALVTMATLAQERARERGFVQSGDESRDYQDLPSSVKAMETRRIRRGPSEQYKSGFVRKNRYAPRPTRPLAKVRRKFAKGKIVGRKVDFIEEFRDWSLAQFARDLPRSNNFTRSTSRGDLDFTIRKSRGHLTAVYTISGQTATPLRWLAAVARPNRQKLKPMHTAFRWSAKQFTRWMQYHNRRF